MNPKRAKLEAMLEGFQSVAQIAIALKAPGVVAPEWLEGDFQCFNLSYAYPGVGILIDDAGFIATGLKVRGVMYGIQAPWSAVVMIRRPDGSEMEQWTMDPEKPPLDENNAYVIELPWVVITRDDAIKVVHMCMLSLGECEENSPVRFVLAKPPPSAYTGLRLVIDNTKHTFKPLDPPPINVA